MKAKLSYVLYAQDMKERFFLSFFPRSPEGKRGKCRLQISSPPRLRAAPLPGGYVKACQVGGGGGTEGGGRGWAKKFLAKT